MSKKKGNIEVQSENIFDIIKRFLYSDQEIFLRELVSNAVDAIHKLQTLARKGEFDGKFDDPLVEIKLDTDKKTLTISDNGIGMTEDEVRKYLNQIAVSGAKEFMNKYEGSNIIGNFGLGFYSAFMVADKVEVDTKSYKKDAKPVLWSCEGSPETVIGEGTRKEHGTDITLYISEDSKEFLNKSRIEGLLNKYDKFLPVKIKFGTKTITEYVGEGDDRKEIKKEVDNIINEREPIWMKNPNDLKDEDYISFYNYLYPMSPPPMFWIHLNIDYPFNLRGVLYFPKLTNNIELERNKIQLYSNQVYVTDEVKDIVPEFLTLLHGVIDSPDIPLNVSRSYLQSDSNVRRITGYITKKVAEKLHDLYFDERESFEEKWDDISLFVKYGMITDEKFFDKAKKFFLLKNTEGKYFTIEEYKEKFKANQTNKDGKMVILYTNHIDAHAHKVSLAKERGYDVVVFDHPIDNHLMQQLEQKIDDIQFARIDSDTLDNLIEKEENKESILSEKEQEKVKELFTEVIGDSKGSLMLKPMSTNEPPVTIIRPESLRRMQEMQMMQSMGGMDFDFYNIVVNTNHPLVAKLLKKRGDNKKAFAKYLYDLALLSHGMLKGDAMTDFINNSIEFLGGDK